jgi:hypothetical protein
VTAGPQEEARVCKALEAGVAAVAAQSAALEAMQQTVGGSEVFLDAAGPGDTAVPWFGTSSTAPAVSPPQTRAPNVTDPLDNSQSQPA